MSALSIIIPARNAAPTLPWVLDGMAAQDYDGQREVILVDNGSSDETGSIGLASSLVSRVVRIDGRGPADSRNAGAAVAGGDWLAFLDADCRPTASWLSNGARELARADLVQGATAPDPEVVLGAFDRTLSVPAFTGLFESANLFVRREVFERVGGFQHWLRAGTANRRPFGEDVVFGWRAVRAGARATFSPGALVHHAVFRRGPGSFVAERLRERFFPALVREVPELRDHFCYRRWFLSRRSALFDLALAGVAIAYSRQSPLGLIAAIPYARLEGKRMAQHGTAGALTVAAVDLLADGAGVLALLSGSVRGGSPLL